MQIPQLGTVTKHSHYDWHYSEPIPVPVLGNKLCRVVLERYSEDQNKEEFHTAIANFLSIDDRVLKAAAPHLFQYYKDCNAHCNPADQQFVRIKSPAAIWPHVHFGNEPIVSRRASGDKGIYISLECRADWEEDNGLQIVFRNGRKVNKVGPYDGHLTNSDAYADDSLEDTSYPAA